MPQIYDMGPTALLPFRRRACREFFRPKNLTVSAGFEPANLVTKGQHATPRPPKPLTAVYASHIIKYYPVIFDKTPSKVNYFSKGKGKGKVYPVSSLKAQRRRRAITLPFFNLICKRNR